MKILQFYPFSKSPGEEARVGVLRLASIAFGHPNTTCLGPSPRTLEYMRKRNNRIWCRLNDQEYYQHQIQVRKSGLSQEAFLRKLINGHQIKEAPPIEYQVMISQLSGIGNNLNQIAARANSINLFESNLYKKNFEELQRVLIHIETALI